ncbi:hypothetical protein A9Q99_25680 [Gammaproteobacteria bacterium 45_16_T64]|nr:hypothetical protein A9Q99_25680 [Gammaproteobacteria bacterium 45_16_T64]
MSKVIDQAWDFAVKIPGGEQKSIVTLKSDGDALVGTMNSEEYGVQDIEDGSFDGETLTWKSKTTKPMKLTLKYTAKLDDANNMTGFVKVAMAKMKFSGTPISA